MTVSFSQSSQYDRKNEYNFGAITIPDTANNIQHVAPKEQMNMLQNMNLPGNRKELIEWSPYFATAVGASIGVSKFAKMMACSLKDSNATIEQSFQNSVLARTATKMDDFFEPALKKIFPAITRTKKFVSDITPKFIKDFSRNVAEKFHIGATPINRLAQGQIRGLTAGAAEGFVCELKKLKQEQLAQLGITTISNDAKTAVTDVVKAISQKGLNIGQVQKIAGKNFIPSLNTARAFMVSNNKTCISKWLQKIFMYNAEGAGGAVVGGAVFGIIMNSIFLAATIKRTIQAPWGDKFSTFMEGAMCDFCGGMIINCVLAPKLTYKLLGLKHLDKTAHELTRIKQLRQGINNKKIIYKQLCELEKMLKSGKEIPSEALVEFLNKLPNSKEATQILTQGNSKTLVDYLAKTKTAYSSKINKAIDHLSRVSKFKSNGFWKNLIYRPVHWIGSFFNVGLENIPSKVATTNVSSLKVGLQKCLNFLKGSAGYPIRFILVTTVIGGLMMKWAAKISHTVFGKPKKSYYEDGSENKEQTIIPQNQKQNPYKIDMDTFLKCSKETGAIRAKNTP